MMSKKTLLLDIDYTLMDQNTPRPYLKEFLERMKEKFEIRLFTAASHSRVTDVCRVLIHDFKMDREFVRDIIPLQEKIVQWLHPVKLYPRSQITRKQR